MPCAHLVFVTFVLALCVCKRTPPSANCKISLSLLFSESFIRIQSFLSTLCVFYLLHGVHSSFPNYLGFFSFLVELTPCMCKRFLYF